MAEAIKGMQVVLQMIGFNPTEADGIMDAGLSEFEEFRFLVEKDSIRDMLADYFGMRPMVRGRIVFGLGRTKNLTGVLMHWMQDCFRANDIPNHNDFNEPALFEALSLAQMQKSDIDLVYTKTMVANPGKFKDEQKWPESESSSSTIYRSFRA
jgi:hypothetical protein